MCLLIKSESWGINRAVCLEVFSDILARFLKFTVEAEYFHYFLKRNSFIITNLIHKFLVHSHKLHKIKFLYVFRAQSAHHQEVDANFTYAASGIVTLCKWSPYATAKERLPTWLNRPHDISHRYEVKFNIVHFPFTYITYISFNTNLFHNAFIC
jgi:hypothetical protein